MKRLLATGLCCGVIAVALAAEPKTNQPAGTASSGDTPAAASTNAPQPLAAMRAEFEEISGKLQEFQKQATNAPEVKAVMAEFETARKEYQAAQNKVKDLQTKLRETVIAEVTKQDPAAKALIDRQQELIKQIRSAGPTGLTNRPSRMVTRTNQPSATPADPPPPARNEPKPAETK